MPKKEKKTKKPIRFFTGADAKSAEGAQKIADFINSFGEKKDGERKKEDAGQ